MNTGSGTEVTFVVAELPPAKSEAKSSRKGLLLGGATNL